MKRSFLEKLFNDLEMEDSVKKNIIDKIMDENGNDITTLKTEIVNLKEDISVKDGVIETKNAKITELEKVDIEAIRKEEYNRGKEEGSKELDDFKKTEALKRSIKGAKDFDLVKSKLDLEKLEYEKNDKGEYKVSGIEEQIKNIKEKYDFLFENEESKTVDLGGNHKDEPGDEPTTLLEALKEEYK